MEDYKLRGPELEHFSYLEFVRDTWEKDSIPNKSSKKGNTIDVDKDSQSAARPAGSVRNSRPGRPLHVHSEYLPAHPKSGKRMRVVRAAGHNTLPNVLGPFFERSDRPETYDLHCASMLALLKPWRSVTELPASGSNWANSLEAFKTSASPCAKRILSGVDFYYQSSEAALDQSQLDGIGGGLMLETGTGDASTSDDEMLLADEMELLGMDLGKSGAPKLTGEELHGLRAVEIGQNSGILHAKAIWDVSPWSTESMQHNAHSEVANWARSLALTATAERAARMNMVSPLADVDVAGASVNLDDPEDLGLVFNLANPQPAPIPDIEVKHLNAEQRRAYDIVQDHVLAQGDAEPQPQLLMQILGEGGTGKSTVIKAITEFFNTHGRSRKLLKAAPTGIAASLIGGCTLHTLCHMGIGWTDPDSISVKTLQVLRKTWKDVQYLIIDEISMVSRQFLSRISSAICAAKGVKRDDGIPFGGVNVIIAGDFHQFPPVAGGKSAALYWPCNPARDSSDNILGRKTFERFNRIVILTEQCRTKDPVRQGVLQHVRHGSCTPEHLAILQSLVISHPSKATKENDVQGDTWQNAILITPRNEVRSQWNSQANRRHCSREKQRLFLCPAEDTYCGRALTTEERDTIRSKQHAATQNSIPVGNKNILANIVELAIGMKVMITSNIETSLDMANGSRGTIEKIIFDERENIDGNFEHIVELSYPPRVCACQT